MIMIKISLLLNIFLFFIGISSIYGQQQSQQDQTIYYIYQGKNQPSCTGYAIAIQGQVIDNSFQIQRTSTATRFPPTTNFTCEDESFCLLNPQSNECLSLTGGIPTTTTSPAQISVSYTSTSDIDPGSTVNNGAAGSETEQVLLECDTSNSDYNQPLCTMSPQPCSNSTVLSSCLYTLVTKQQLIDDPTLLENSNPPSELEETIYTIYYQDKICTELEGIQGNILETNYTPNTAIMDDNSISCQESMVCMLNPTGPSCADIIGQKRKERRHLQKTATGQFQYQKDDNNSTSSAELVFCTGSSVDSCQTVTVSCTQSTEYPSCYRRIVKGTELFSDPESIITPPIPVDYGLNQTYYLIYFGSLNARECYGTAVSIEGAVIGDRNTYQTVTATTTTDDMNGTSSSSCSMETTCLIDPTSQQCINIIDGQIDTTQVQVTYTSTNSLQLCDTSNPTVDDDLCILNPPPCDPSSIYTSCTYALLTGTELMATPNILQNDDPPDISNNVVYIVYYTNNACTKFGAVRGLMMDTANTFEHVEDLDLYTCQDTLVCFLSPNGEACQDTMKTNGTSSLYFTMSSDTSTLQSCMDIPGKGTSCGDVDFEACQASEWYPGCYYSTVLGSDLLQNPIRYIVPPTNAPSSAPTANPAAASTASPTTEEGSEPSSSSIGIYSGMRFVIVILFELLLSMS